MDAEFEVCHNLVGIIHKETWLNLEDDGNHLNLSNLKFQVHLLCLIEYIYKNYSTKHQTLIIQQISLSIPLIETDICVPIQQA